MLFLAVEDGFDFPYDVLKSVRRSAIRSEVIIANFVPIGFRQLAIMLDLGAKLSLNALSVALDHALALTRRALDHVLSLDDTRGKRLARTAITTTEFRGECSRSLTLDITSGRTLSND